MARVAVVSGGTRGIGAAVGKALKEAGFKVAATHVGPGLQADAFHAETGIPAYRWDAADPAACEEGLKRVAAELGPVDVLVNNAGIVRDGFFHKMDWASWSAVIHTNLDSMFAMTRPVINGMRDRGFGRVINIASVNGQKGQMGQVNYSASKAGVIGFTKALALENARKGVTVNCIAPGYIDTDMMAGIAPEVLSGIVGQIPAGRLGKVEEIAAIVAFLASDAAGFITGAVIAANGGQYMAG
ncbi:MAG: acetoacetyl-CoA reductase [Alphaproteobacteria bacterium]